MNFYKQALIAILFVLFFSACAVSDQTDLSAEELLAADIDFLVGEIQTMYDYARPELLYDPPLHIAFADIDFDGVPEFFFGYQTMTGSHNKIWYRAYSIKDHSMIDSEHPLAPYWGTYLDDEACAFFTGPPNFMEGYFLDSDGEPCFVTQAYAGPVTDPRTDFVFIKYKNSKLFIETGFECDESLTPAKQAWTLTTLDNMKDDIIELFNEYSATDAK